jgi:hypothetical protein
VQAHGGVVVRGCLGTGGVSPTSSLSSLSLSVVLQASKVLVDVV